MGLLKQFGAAISNLHQPKYTTLFQDRTLNGLYTQRAVFHDSTDVITSKYYGGAPDSMWQSGSPSGTSLGTAFQYAILAGSAVTNTGASIIAGGNVGSFPTNSITPGGWTITPPAAQVTATAQNQADLAAAIALYQALPSNPIAGSFGTTTFTATGAVTVFTASSTLHFTGGTVTLDGAGFPNPVFVFQIGSALTVDTAITTVNFVNGATAADTFWVVGSSATFDAHAHAFAGNILAHTSITLNGGTLNGRALANIGAVTISSATDITVPTASNGSITSINVELSNDLTLIRGYGTTNWTTATYPTPPLRAFNFQLEDGSIQVLIDTVTEVYFDNQDGTKTLIFTKSAGAGETYFMAVGDTVYMGNGADVVKYTPGNPNGIEWLWGIAAPAAQPTAIITESGAAAVAWQALTSFSTMGFVVDANNNVQQLYSVNANNNNATRFGTSSDGAPNFSTGLGGTTVDGTVTWTSQGPITLWLPNTLYQPGAAIYDPATNSILIQAATFAGTSGSTHPSFVCASSQPLIGRQADGAVYWQCLGPVQPYTPLASNIETNAAFYPWVKNSPVRYYDTRTHSGPLSFYECAMPFPLAPFISNVGGATELCNGVPTYLLGATSNAGGGQAGTTANTGYTPWAGIPTQVPGDITTDNDLKWLCLGSATWTASTPYFQFEVGETLFSAISDGTNMQVCIQSGTSGGSTPDWGVGYGEQCTDGGVIWVCVGPVQSWTVSTIWYLPVAGFYPPQTSQPFGGSEVVFNLFVQAVTSSGVSGATIPAFSNTIGQSTTDGGIVWQNIAAANINSLSWTKGHTYAYSFKCRTPNDYYTTNVPPGLNVPNGPYKGGGTGAISTASPFLTITGGNSGAVVTLSGVGSTDPQVDTIVIWRDADGGGPDNMFELTEIPAPPPKANVAQPWSFNDFLPDVPTALYPGLDVLAPAPIDDSNDPPPTTFKPFAWHFQRVWGGNATFVEFSDGPDCITGNPNEAFNPINEFPFLSIVTDAIHTPAGLVTVLETDIECIYGGPSTVSFFSTTLCPGKGALSFNAIDTLGGEIYMVSSDSQVLVISPSLQISRVGFPIGDKVAKWDASKAYLSILDEGTDNAVYISDGSTGYYRLNPHQVPQGNAVWSPFREINGGCKMMQAVTVAPGVKYLLIGSTEDNQSILKRDITVYTDNGTPYESNFEIGAITLADAGEVAVCKFMEMDFAGVGTPPLVYVALDDPTTTPTWTQLTTKAYDPPSVYGQTKTPPYYPIRYYFDPHLAVCRRIRFKVEYGDTDTVRNELYGFSIMGKLQQEK